MSAIKVALMALAVARSSEADEAILAVYLRSLDDMDPSHVRRACERLGREPRAEYQAALPDVGTVRATAAAIAREDRETEHRRMLAPLPSDADPRTWVSCLDCLDTSWRSYRCDGGTGETGDRDSHLRRVYCGRRNWHYAHSYTVRCQCFDTNPVIARRRERYTEARA